MTVSDDDNLRRYGTDLKLFHASGRPTQHLL